MKQVASHVKKRNATEMCPKAYSFLQEKLSSAKNNRRIAGLKNVWSAIESQIIEGEGDFRYSSIGAFTVQLGGPTTQTIRNANGLDYRRLIDLAAGEATNLGERSASSGDALASSILEKISDRGTRHAVQIIMHENRSLRNEVNLMKKEIFMTAPPISMREQPVSKIASPVDSTKLMAVREFISERNFQAKGWRLNEYGAIVDGFNEEIAPVGLYAVLLEFLSN